MAENENTPGPDKSAEPQKSAPGGGRGARRGPRRSDGQGEGRDGREGRGRGRGRDRRRRDESEEQGPEYIETLIDVYRCSATVKGGRRLSFGALVTVGDGKGRVGIGYGKAKEVPGAIQKAIKRGRQGLSKFPIAENETIPHEVIGRFGASSVTLIPAGPGTGVIAGAAVKAILEAGGLKNVLTKSMGSNNTRNVTKATLNALQSLRSREQIAALRGVEL